MANEGATKPTYSELEAENLRVRGLLQRGYHLFNVEGTDFAEPEEVGEKWMEEVEFELKIGAESADIGKLDRVDKSGSVGFEEVMEWARKDFESLNFPNDGLRNAAWDLVKRVAQKAELIRELDDKPCTGCPMCADADEIALAGSAETGGEKADHESEIVELSLQAWQYAAYIGEWDEAQAEEWRAEAEVVEIKLHRAVSDLAKLRGLNFKQFPTVRRSSQDQTVSSGVEGAHEGTTADKSGSKAAPEKEYSLARRVARRIMLDKEAVGRCRHGHGAMFKMLRVEEIIEEELADSREPEKLNNAHTLRRAEEIAEQHQCDDICKIEGCGYKIADDIVALAESSLSQNADSSAPTIPEPRSTQLDTRKEK